MPPPGEGELCCRFTIDGLRQVRQASLAWALKTGLSEERATDFVLALNEITSNAIRHGSPAAVLRLRLDGQSDLLAEVTDSGRWTAQPDRPDETGSSRGLALARLVCEQVTIDPSPQGTTVTLRMTGWPGVGCGGGGQQPG